MAPGYITEPEASNQFKQGYKEGFEAGKNAIRKELKAVLDDLKGKEPFPTSTSTSSYGSNKN